MSEIKKTGEVVKMKGHSVIPRTRREPSVLGAQPIRKNAKPEILDQHSETGLQSVEVKTHEEIVTVQSHTRSKPKRKSDPEVRVRSMPKEARDAWNRAKRGED